MSSAFNQDKVIDLRILTCLAVRVFVIDLVFEDQITVFPIQVPETTPSRQDQASGYDATFHYPGGKAGYA